VSQLRDAPGVVEDEGYWISKSWLKGCHPNFSKARYDFNWVAFLDWRLDKPKMHVSEKSDPPPDDVSFQDHVVCDHGSLNPDSRPRQLISQEVCCSAYRNPFIHSS
jgi:hypothetical protein